MARGEGDGPGEWVQSRVVLSLLLSQQGVPLYNLSGSKVVPYASCDREGQARVRVADVYNVITMGLDESKLLPCFLSSEDGG